VEAMALCGCMRGRFGNHAAADTQVLGPGTVVDVTFTSVLLAGLVWWL